MTLASVLMLGVLSSYIFLGRNNTRLSYQHALEIQGRSLLYTLGGDLRNAKSVSSASSTGFSLILVDGSQVTYAYDGSSLLTRDAGSGAVSVTRDITGETVQVPVTIPACTFNYYTTSDGSPTFQGTSTLVPLSIKQVGLALTLQAGNTTQSNSGTQTRFQVNSGWLLLRNKQLPDGS